ncbi:cytidylyltransferase-like protein [Chloropicon primus]|uniref:Cytidyltransferase-like domain-containing protein n=1 Tax=Chloropicon primus TaxID=1764295 RepID=A0A5B8MS10_9CHLO|nr:hypothetical protein A3770_10p57740 [Chloropicon primus]UPR02468.1 cytidylyltransferase-like protein [Chloropicon primus]|mmetsp:Transcript_5279/g.15867  ORF Transcript_5279/g.15867 Transcript_5279/m.15867 type:complete len:324 (+) Transcript_5279:203-1174(+)|eukprot:QDZ23256.1 hypothetical protein A3770_10p57740 [Chloropicon primus]
MKFTEPANVLCVDLDKRSKWTQCVTSLGRDGSEAKCPRPLLVFFRGERVSGNGGRKEDVVRILTALYEAAAFAAPRWEVVPLFQFCGWTRRSIAERFNVSRYQEVEDVRVGEADGGRESSLLSSCVVEPEVETCSTSYGSMDEVCVGGTFDRLHAGHRLLLASTVAVCSKTIFVGITSDALLLKKRNRELLETFDTRKDRVEEFIRCMNPSLQVAIGVLGDVSRAPMPQEFVMQVDSGELNAGKPLAITSESMDGIVVSRETVSGATAINDERATLGYEPLVVISVNLVGATRQNTDAKKLSSSDLRELDAAAGVAKSKKAKP